MTRHTELINHVRTAIREADLATEYRHGRYNAMAEAAVAAVVEWIVSGK